MQVTGTVTITVNGITLRSNEGASLTFGGKTRTPVIGHEYYGYSEKPVNAEVECNITHTADTDVALLRDLVDATVVFATDTGKQYLIANAFTMDVMRLTGGNGELTLHMSGKRAEEI